MTMEKIIKKINESNTILITTHKSPDGDAIGSSIALGKALKSIGKNVSYLIETPIHEKFDYLTEIKYIKSDIIGSFDIGIFLDCSDINHLFDSTANNNCKYTINIDHHVSNDEYCNVNYIDSSASATGEIIFKLINNLNIDFDKEIAAAIYTSIVTDTGNFKYSNVTSLTHKIVSKLYKYDNEYWQINRKLFDEHSYNRMKLIGKALSNLRLVKDNTISIISLSLHDMKEFSNSRVDGEIEGIINYGRDIKGIKVAILIKEINDQVYKTSLRSNSNFDVSKLAVEYGGGGHSKAAGFSVHGMTMDELINSIIHKIDRCQ